MVPKLGLHCNLGTRICYLTWEKGLLAEMITFSRREHLVLSEWALKTTSGVLMREGHWEI